MLRLEGISASYGAIDAIENVSLEIPAHKTICLLGANGAGKSTTLNCISGVVPLKKGRITYDDDVISGLPMDQIVARGIVQVPEGREIFPEHTVQDNLVLGAWVRRRELNRRVELDRVYEIFPRLRERARQPGGTLSGGEQQMLMIGRALMAKPKIILFDEPSLGLSPILVESIFDVIAGLRESGITMLIVEQNTRIALQISDYGYVLENGEIRLEGTSAELADHPEISDAYLGS